MKEKIKSKKIKKTKKIEDSLINELDSFMGKYNISSIDFGTHKLKLNKKK